jgi:hypothetical protein
MIPSHPSARRAYAGICDAVPSPITPAEPLPPLPEILPRGSLVIVEGRVPGVGHGFASAARLASCRRGLLRSAPRCSGSGQPQPKVGRGAGSGCDAARREVDVRIVIIRYLFLLVRLINKLHVR